MAKIGRNAPCPCGSGKKYKKCCLGKDEQQRLARLEQQERNRNQAKRLAEEDAELFEEVLFKEECTDDFDDDSDVWDEQETSEELDLPASDRLSPTQPGPGKSVPMQIPQISAAEQAIVEQWWQQCTQLKGIDKVRQHVEDFFREHPKLVPNLALHQELLFELGADHVREGRAAEYIDLLLTFRNQFPDAYVKGFGYFDLEIISHYIAVGRRNEIIDYLNYFKEYPAHDPDNLFKAVALMAASNCQETLAAFVEDVYYELCTSPQVWGGEEILEYLVMAYFAPFLKPGFTDADLEELAARLQTIRIPLREEYYRPDFLRRRFRLILNPCGGWNIDDCPTRSEIFDRYHQISLNYMGFLHRHQEKDWLAAKYYQQILFRYLVNAVPEGKRPKATFVFTRDRIEATIARTCKSFLFLHSTAALVSLNAIYWFAEYLEATGSIPEQRRTAIQTWCTELYRELFPDLATTHLSAKAFDRFPK